jgi:hypothetical protein
MNAKHDFASASFQLGAPQIDIAQEELDEQKKTLVIVTLPQLSTKTECPGEKEKSSHRGDRGNKD